MEYNKDARNLVAHEIADELREFPMCDVWIEDDKLIMLDHTGTIKVKTLLLDRVSDSYYLIINNSPLKNEGPSYLWVINGTHMMQSSIYDATKFTTKELAEKRLELIKNLWSTQTTMYFEVISVDKRIFGKQPRSVVNFEAGYITSDELTSYCDGEYLDRIKWMYDKYPNGFFRTVDQAMCFYNGMYKEKDDQDEMRLRMEIESMGGHRHG